MAFTSASNALRTVDYRDPVQVLEPLRQLIPFVFASPHSGTDYPAAFLSGSPLDLLTIRQSEDSFVDEIFASAPHLGAPLLCARFPRAYCDPNREPFELDQGMFEDTLPAYANTTSLRVAGGLGVIARITAGNKEIYSRKLTFAEAERRIAGCYQPYHAALRTLIDRTKRQFGHVVLIDCHSMPSSAGSSCIGHQRRRPDMILGDRYGTSCDRAVIDIAEQLLRDLGYHVGRNAPYAGGFTTQHYGRPSDQVHSLQIEINRALYMDERCIKRRPGLASLAEDMATLIDGVATRLDLAAG